MTRMVPFSITAGWEPRRPPRVHNEDDVALWSEEMRALFRFVAEFDGPLTLHFGDLAIQLDLADLSYVYDELEKMAAALRTEGEEAELYFAAQGTALRLAMRRTGETVTVGFHPGYAAPEEFVSLAGRSVSVDANRFIGTWLELRSRVRAAMSRAR